MDFASLWREVGAVIGKGFWLVTGIVGSCNRDYGVVWMVVEWDFNSSWMW